MKLVLNFTQEGVRYKRIAIALKVGRVPRFFCALYASWNILSLDLKPHTQPHFSADKVFRHLLQFIDAAMLECRSIATGAGLAAHEIPLSFHVEIEQWTVSIQVAIRGVL
jgi:hypothetical protein